MPPARPWATWTTCGELPLSSTIVPSGAPGCGFLPALWLHRHHRGLSLAAPKQACSSQKLPACRQPETNFTLSPAPC